ncbi:hypothetical protein JL722_11770 [Aureococcus anophagefferens]|nr:hypothetical protein JL722_11770 [Aureococcus anophagefferens]
MSEPAARRATVMSVKCKFSVRVVDAQSDEALRLRVPFAAEATVAEFKKEILIRAKKKGFTAASCALSVDGDALDDNDTLEDAVDVSETIVAALSTPGASAGSASAPAPLPAPASPAAGAPPAAAPRRRPGAAPPPSRRCRRRLKPSRPPLPPQIRPSANPLLPAACFVFHCSKKTEAECFRLNVLACRYSRAAIDLAGIRAGTRLAVYNINEKHARGFMTATSGAQRASSPPSAARGGAARARRAAGERSAAAAAAALAEAKCAQARRSGATKVVLDVANIGHHDSPPGAVRFSWNQVAAAFAYYATRRSFDVRGFLSFHTHRKNEYPPLEEFAWRDKITIGLRFEPGEIVGVLDLGDHHAMVLDAASGAGATLFERDRRRRHFSSGDAAARAVAGDDLGRAGTYLRACSSRAGGRKRRASGASCGAAGQARRDALCRAAPAAAAGVLSPTMKCALLAGALAQLRAAGASAPALVNWWGRRDDDVDVADVFEDVDLVDQSEVMPYKGQRLLRPVRLEGSSKVYSYAAVAEGFGAGEGGWADTLAPSTSGGPGDGARSRHAGKDALLLTAAARAAPLQRPGGRALAETYERDCRDRSSPLRVATPVELKAARAPLLYDASGHLVVCESCGTTQADKGAGGGTTTELSIYSTHTGARCVVEADKLALAHATLGPKRLPLAGAGGVAVRSATLIIVDCSESMGGEFRRYEDEKGDVDAYENPEVRVRLELDDASPKTAVDALPEALRRRVKKTKPDKLKRDDSRGKVGSFSGTVFVKFASAGVGDIEPRGETALWDAVVMAVGELVAFRDAERSRDPAAAPCKLRVVALTDGRDTRSSASRAKAAAAALAARVTVDAILIGSPGTELADVARLTGGDVYAPEDMGSLVSLCSSADFVAAAEADRPAKLNADASLKDVDQWLRRHRRGAAAASRSRRPRPRRRRRRSSRSPRARRPPSPGAPGSSSGAPARGTAAATAGSCGTSPRRPRRTSARSASSCEDQLDVWRALIAAPAYSDWARGAFELCVAFGDGYPHEPPTVTFVTPILHPNVDARTGRACHAILGTAWHSEMRALDVIVAVRSLLMAPEPSDALDQSEAVDADDDDDDDDDDDGSGPVCPLTQARARVPVCAPSGVVYDERALREAWAAAGDLPHDPVMTEAAGETVILDPLMLDFCPVARPEDKRIAQLRIAEADAAAPPPPAARRAAGPRFSRPRARALPPSAFLSADAFNIPDKIRGLFFDLNNLGAKAEQILGGSDARFESTLAAMGAEVL